METFAARWPVLTTRGARRRQTANTQEQDCCVAESLLPFSRARGKPPPPDREKLDLGFVKRRHLPAGGDGAPPAFGSTYTVTDQNHRRSAGVLAEEASS